MNISDLIYHIQCGEEIELRICGNNYFIQPNYERFNPEWSIKNPPYSSIIIYNSNVYDEPVKIFEGTANDVVNYAFENRYTLKDNLREFKLIW